MEFTHNASSLYYETHGTDGQPLLLLHGWGGSCDSWLPLIRDFEKTRRVVAVDFPGNGNRSPEPAVPWSVTEYMEQIAALIHFLSIEGTDIVAHSFGGRVALLLAATYPALVGKLLLTGCAGLPNQPDAAREKKASMYQRLKGMADNAFTRRVLGDKTVDGLREKLIQKYGSADYKVLSPMMRQTFSRVVGQDLTDCLARIQSPTLLIWGQNDTMTPLWMGQKMEREIRDAGLVVFPDAGHFAYLDKYADFSVIAQNFLNG